MTLSGMPMMMMRPITGAPFSGVRESEHKQTLADGTHISQKQPLLKLYRDVDGRMRTERALFFGPNAPSDGPILIQISDPVAGYAYTLDQQNKVAHRTALSERTLQAPPPPRLSSSVPQNRIGQIGAVLPPGSTGASITFDPLTARNTDRATAASTGSRQFRPQFQRESLGTKTIEGLLVEGNKTIMTIPEGEQGNDRPITTITESWTSSDLQETIESVTSDPRSGEFTMRLTNIDRNNPDPALFQVPSDYEIVDGHGSFNIPFNRSK
jgi:hypothetical protein